MAILTKALGAAAFGVLSTATCHAQDASCATPIDEEYREQFHQCDANGKFRGIILQGDHKCSGDPYKVSQLGIRKDCRSMSMVLGQHGTALGITLTRKKPA